MIDTENDDFGCNIAVFSSFEEHYGAHKDKSRLQKLVEIITEAIKESYANSLFINVVNRMFEDVEALHPYFPIKAVIPIPSSMGRYETQLYILDVSKVKRISYFTTESKGKWHGGCIGVTC